VHWQSLKIIAPEERFQLSIERASLHMAKAALK
jgi:hypothetical protein